MSTVNQSLASLVEPHRCSRCRHHRDPNVNSWDEQRCEAPGNREYYITNEGIEYRLRDEPRKINRDGNCSWYMKAFWCTHTKDTIRAVVGSLIFIGFIILLALAK